MLLLYIFALLTTAFNFSGRKIVFVLQSILSLFNAHMLLPIFHLEVYDNASTVPRARIFVRFSLMRASKRYSHTNVYVSLLV